MADPAIVIDGVDVHLGGTQILDGISIVVEEGAFTALVGPNGSGKTTLVRTLYRAIRPTTGTITIRGRRLETYRQTELAQTLAVLRQEPDMAFEFLVEELVLAGRSPYKGWLDLDGPDDRRAVDDALAMTDTIRLRHRSFGTLSGGEKQRVLLARALAQEPSILLLDEPTNHLDIRHRLEVLSCVRGLGITVLAALHDIALADRYATDAVMLAEGRVHATGAPSDVLSADNLRTVFGVETRRTGVGELSFELRTGGSQ